MKANLKAWVKSPAYDNTVHKYSTAVKNFILNICIAVIILGVCYIILSPVFGIISRAFMTYEDVRNPLIFLIPQNLTLDSVRYAILHMGYWRTLFLTLGFAIGFSLLHVVVCSMVGYGFARFKFPASNALFAIVILTIVVPVHSYMVPMFLNFRFFPFGLTNVSLLNSPVSLGLLTATGVGLRSGLYIYIFRQFFRGLPKEIEEAALIDGAGPVSTYVRVMLPNAVPAIVTVLLFAFVWHYNDTFYTSLLMGGNDLMSTRLQTLANAYSMAENVHSNLLIQMVVYAGVMLAIVPVLSIYLFFQRYFVEGLERSGIVG